MSSSPIYGVVSSFWTTQALLPQVHVLVQQHHLRWVCNPFEIGGQWYVRIGTDHVPNMNAFHKAYQALLPKNIPKGFWPWIKGWIR